MSANTDLTSEVPALDRGLNVLEFVMESSRPVSMKEIATELGIPTTSVFRLIKALTQRGYLLEIGSSQQFYLPGNKIFQLAQFYQLNHSLYSVARIALRELAEQTEQAAQLAIMKGTSVMYIDQAIPKEPVSIIAPLHNFIPINVSASGKIICSYLRHDELLTYLGPENLQKRTDSSIADLATFVTAVAAARQQGYATDIEEFARGIGAAAAAIWDGDNRCAGAIGVTGYVADYQNKGALDRILRLVLESAEAVSRRMGYTGIYPRP